MSYSQEDVFGNSPVQGIIPIKRGDIQENKASLNRTNITSNNVTPSTPTGNSTEVGVTEGQLSVSLTGGATYNIPIAVPPGINGIVPQVSLSYNSQGGNGLAGYGWNISGVSVITRIPTTKFHDNTIDAVDFNNLDRFAFDGQRLIVKNGTTGAYGANGTVYETESFSNVQITSYGVHPSGANYGPAYFIVQYPDGSIAHYGNSTTSRSLTDWAITYWENPQGVRISYNYVLSDNNLSIASIKYGTLTTTAPINEISFVYKTRVRPEQAYIGGQSFLRSTILSEIKVKGNNIGFRNYLLTHETTTLGYERLKSITEKSGDNSKSFNPTVFNYETTNYDNLFHISNPIQLNVNNLNFTNSSNISGDFNGDGKMDFILYPTTGADAKKKYWLFNDIQGTGMNIGSEHNVGSFIDIFPMSWLSWNNKLMPSQGWCAIQTNTTTNTTTFNTYSTGTVSSIYFQYARTYQFPKFTFGYWIEPCNNNVNPFIGLNRIIDPIDPDDPVYYEVTKEIPKEYLNGDFNGDGLTDVIIIEKPVSVNYYTGGCNGYNTTYTNPGGKAYFLNLDRRITTDYVDIAGYLQVTANSKFAVADINGDGKTDLIVFNSGNVKVYSIDLNRQLVEIINFNEQNINLETQRFLGDFNGDGKMDFVIPKSINSLEWNYYLSKGNSFHRVAVSDSQLGFGYGPGYFTPFPSTTEIFQEMQYLVNDINSDGFTDIIVIANNTCSGNTGCVDGTPIKTMFNIFENLGFDGNTIKFKRLIYNSPFFNTTFRYPIPVFLDHNKVNQNSEIAIISGDKVRSIKSVYDSKENTRLKEIILGNGVKEKITYTKLSYDDINPYDSSFMPSTYTENYPNYDVKVTNSFQIVSRIEKTTSNQYSKQDFKYYGAVSNLDGLGFLGFRGLARTNWYNDNQPIITSVSKHDISKRGAISETYTALGDTYGNFISYTPSNFINKTNMTYVDQLLPNKVYKINNTFTNSINGLENTSKEVTTSYDANNNPLITTSVSKNGTTVERTEVVNVEYFPNTSGSTYTVGRLKKKNSSVTHNGDTMTGEEIYTYNTAHLVSKIQKKGHLTNYLTEDNIYDVFGNITQKKITAVGLTPRTTNFTYDTTGRFLLTSTDIEGLVTTYTYNTSNGLLLTQTLPSNAGYPLTTTYLYDLWGKKTKETDYLGKSLNYSYSWLSAGTNGFFETSSSGDDNSASFAWFDDLGRKIADGFKTINDASSTESNKSWKTFEYDIYDRAIKTYEPKLSLLPTWEGLYSTTSFDAFGRTTQVVEHTGKTSTINYNGLTTTASDGVSNTTVVKNSLGNVVSMTDNGGTINYQYYANGNLKQSNFNGVIVAVEQDGWGRKTKLIDPSAGTYEYQYNEFGEITKEISPKGVSNYTIDTFGKVTQKTIVGTGGDPTNTKTTYTYNPTTKLLTNTRYDDFTGGFYTLYSYGYDNYKRINFSDESGFNAYYQRATQFDAFGRPEKELYTAVNTSDSKQSSKWVKNTYKNGHHWQILDDATNQVLWQTTKVNARGQLTNGNYGNGINVTNTYDQYGFPTQFKHDKTGTPVVNVMTLNTVFEPQRGNLTSRYISLFNQTDNFTYDNLDRLVSYPDKNEVIVQQTYDGLGRINQNNVGTYNYTNVNPSNSVPKHFQNSSIETNSEYSDYYLSRANLDITYNAFKSPIDIIEEGKDKLSFIYNMNNSRSTMYYGSFEADKLSRRFRKHYAADGSMEIKQDMVNGTVEFITYIGGDAYSAPIILKSDGTTQNYLYLHRDYLGSIVAVTNHAGTVLEKRLFDAWGTITKVQDGAGNNLIKLSVIDRGYTGHEHLQGVNLIHMNGRLYDPVVHRFLQPDNFIQDPYNTQNFNRYSYVLNNPLKFTDASGEFAWIPVIIGAVFGAYSGAVIANGGQLNPTKWDWNMKTFGYVIGGALVGGVTGGVSNGIATSGVPFANTRAIFVGSLINGMGTHMYTGGKTNIVLSFGFASLDFTTGEFGYLFKKGNSFMANLGYSFGAIANASDILAGMNPREVQLNTDTSDAIGHSAITKVGETDELNSLVSVGPEVTGKRIFNPFDLSNKVDANWHNYVSQDGTWKTIVKGVNFKSISNYSNDLANGAKYNLYFSSCVNHTARALTFAGVPTFGIHPFILHAQVYLRSIGFRPSFILNQYKLY